MIAIPFSGLEEGKGMPVENLKITGFAGSDYTETDCDYIEVWNMEAGSPDAFYYDTDDCAWECSALGYTSLEDAFPDGFTAGQAMWYTAASNGFRSEPLSITVAGGVENQPSVIFYPRALSGSAKTGSMIGSPYPVSWMVTDSEEVVDGQPAPCVITGFAGSDYTETDCDYLEIWDMANGSPDAFYYDTDDCAWECSAMGYTSIADAYPTGIKPGVGFWYTAASAAHSAINEIAIKFINPIKK